jgi:hypothetical protein
MNNRFLDADFSIEWSPEDCDRLRDEVSQEGVDFHALIGSTGVWDIQRCVEHGFIYRGAAYKPLSEEKKAKYISYGMEHVIEEINNNVALFNLHYPEG